MTKAQWDSYLAAASARYEEIERKEAFKRELGNALMNARQALLRDERDWPRLVKAAITHRKNHIISRYEHRKLTN